MHTRHWMTEHTPAERIVIGTIRSAASGCCDGETSFARLALAARRGGFAILAPGAPLLSPGEIALLGCLAWHQRRWTGDIWAVAPALREILARCATELSSRNLRLPYLAIQRVGFLVDEADIRAATAQGSQMQRRRKRMRAKDSSRAQ